MEKRTRWFGLLTGIAISFSALAQTEPAVEKMTVQDRMAKARAAKADKKMTSATSSDAVIGQQTAPNQHTGSLKEEKATSADYNAPVVKTLKGPNGEVVHTGEKGGKYYINKNGNKTYLSSNQ